MLKLQLELERELLTNILPFWQTQTIDHENGGFYGKIHNDLTIEKEVDKGGILNCRILWTFSSAYRIYQKPEYLEIARRAYDYICRYLWDSEFQGVYWAADYKGSVSDDRKQTYVQAFAIYAFSEYFRAAGNRESLERAKQLYRLLEDYCYDPAYSGYFEACDRNWNLKDSFLDAKCGREKKSMNTMLHVLEAYTNLCRIWPSAELKHSLRQTLTVIIDKIINPETCHFKLFFDEAWNSLSDVDSYGHDIEGSWLIWEAAEVLADQALLARVRPIVIGMGESVLKEGLKRGREIQNESDDIRRDWWPQAEAVVGFINLYQMTGKQEYLEKAQSVWTFIQEKIIDHQNGEWFWGVTENGEIQPERTDSKVDFWKCPYHNSRMCMELTERCRDLDEDKICRKDNLQGLRRLSV